MISQICEHTFGRTGIGVGDGSSVFTLRLILTIQKSQGFVWNQVSTFEAFVYESKVSLIILGSIRAPVH